MRLRHCKQDLGSRSIRVPLHNLRSSVLPRSHGRKHATSDLAHEPPWVHHVLHFGLWLRIAFTSPRHPRQDVHASTHVIERRMASPWTRPNVTMHPRFPALSWHVHDHLHPENKLPSSTSGKLRRLTRFRDGSACQILDDPFRKLWVNCEGVRGGRRFGSWRARPPRARLFRASIDRRRPPIVSYACGLLGEDPPASRSASSRSSFEAGRTIPLGGWHCSVDWRSACRHRTCKRTCKVIWCALKDFSQVHVLGGAS